jgi:hypothetical protein
MSFLRAVAWVILIITGMLVILVTARADASEFQGIAGGSTESFFVARGDFERRTRKVFTDAEVTSLVNRARLIAQRRTREEAPDASIVELGQLHFTYALARPFGGAVA